MSNLINLSKQIDLWRNLTFAPPDAILGTALAYKADKNPKKVNLGIGAYRTDEGLPYPFKTVQKVEEIIVSQKLDKEYLPIDGLQSFIQGSQKLIFGNNNKYLKNDCIASIQSLSGTGALSIVFQFLKKHTDIKSIWIPNPSWGNHAQMIKYYNFNLEQYEYYDPKTLGISQNLFGQLENIPNGSCILLHACAHNPTGVDPTKEQWHQIAEICKRKKFLVLFDSAYQGFATGDLNQDAYAIRYFSEQDIQTIVTQSYAKNMGLYGERIGCMHFVCSSPEVKKNLLSQIKLIIRCAYSNPNLHGARIVSQILNDQMMFQMWADELKEVSNRIILIRAELKNEINKLNTPGNWDHITNQIGMFTYTGLTKEQSQKMIDKWHIYMLLNGRISMAGVNKQNVKYVAEAINDVVKN